MRAFMNVCTVTGQLQSSYARHKQWLHICIIPVGHVLDAHSSVVWYVIIMLMIAICWGSFK